MTDKTFNFNQIGLIHSCYGEKFGIPRQPGLVSEARARLELTPPYNQLECLNGIEEFSHLWIQFVFHKTQEDGWRPTIRPPKLGGKTRVGVFATRSTHRPNPIGLSVVKLEGISQEKGKLFLELSGIDLLDQTPVLDIKPYVPYADIITDASEGFTRYESKAISVNFEAPVEAFCEAYFNETGRDLRTLIEQVISQDPRPAYLQKKVRSYGMKLWDLNICWHAENESFCVYEINKEF